MGRFSYMTPKFVMYRGKTGYAMHKWDYLEVYMKRKDTLGCIQHCPLQLHGNFMGYTGDVLWLDLRYSRNTFRDSAGNSHFEAINHNFWFPDYKLNCQPLNPADVDYVKYSSEWRSGWHDASDVMMILSGVSALIASPVAAMRDKGRDFNYPKYLRWTGWSLAAFGVSLGIKIGTQPRKYYLQPK